MQQGFKIKNCRTLRLTNGRAQSGFVSGESTTFQMLHKYHTFCEAVDNDKSDLYSVISAKRSIGSGIRNCFISYVEKVVQVKF